MNIDHNALDNLRLLFGDEFDQHFNFFIKNTGNYLSELEAAINNNDFAEAKSLAHKIVSSTAQYGAMQLSLLAHEMQYNLPESSSEFATACKKMQEEFSLYKNSF